MPCSGASNGSRTYDATANGSRPTTGSLCQHRHCSWTKRSKFSVRRNDGFRSYAHPRRLTSIAFSPSPKSLQRWPSTWPMADARVTSSRRSLRTSTSFWTRIPKNSEKSALASWIPSALCPRTRSISVDLRATWLTARYSGSRSTLARQRTTGFLWTMFGTASKASGAAHTYSQDIIGTTTNCRYCPPSWRATL